MNYKDSENIQLFLHKLQQCKKYENLKIFKIKYFYLHIAKSSVHSSYGVVNEICLQVPRGTISFPKILCTKKI